MADETTTLYRPVGQAELGLEKLNDSIVGKIEAVSEFRRAE